MGNTTIHELWYFPHLLLLNINYLRYYFFKTMQKKRRIGQIAGFLKPTFSL